MIFCKHCASPISNSEFGIKNQMCDWCIGEQLADQQEFEDNHDGYLEIP